MYEVNLLVQGFPGRAVCHGGLGWSTVTLLRGESLNGLNVQNGHAGIKAGGSGNEKRGEKFQFLRPIGIFSVKKLSPQLVTLSPCHLVTAPCAVVAELAYAAVSETVLLAGLQV